MTTTTNEMVSAAEAQGLLQNFARGREKGAATDVWGLFDKAEDLARTVIAREAEVTELRGLLDKALETQAAGGGTSEDGKAHTPTMARREDPIAKMCELVDAARAAYLVKDHRAGDVISAEVDGDAEPCLALCVSLVPDDDPLWQAMVLYDSGMGLVPVVAGDRGDEAFDALGALGAQLAITAAKETGPAE